MDDNLDIPDERTLRQQACQLSAVAWSSIVPHKEMVERIAFNGPTTEEETKFVMDVFRALYVEFYMGEESILYHVARRLEQAMENEENKQ